MIDLFASPWIPAVALLLLTCGARLLCDSWLAPSPFAGLLWTTFVWVSMLATDFPIHASAIWVILLFVFALQLGAFIGGNIVLKPLPDTIAQDREDRGTRDLGLTTLWFSVIIAIIAFATAANRKARFWSLSPVLPSLLVGSAVAARSGIFLSSICWISGFLGVRNWQSEGRYPLFRRRFVLVLAALGAGAVVLFVLVDALRQSQDGQTFDLALDSPRLLKYSLGSLAGFSSWFHQYVPGNSMLGAYTFGGFFDLLGLHHREIGLFQNFESLSGGLETNIYTVLRGLIEDFSLAGTVCISLIVGLVTAIFFNHSSQKAWTPIVFGSAYYAFTLGSPITSIFTYNGLLLAWVMGVLVLRSCFRSAGMHTSAVS